MKNKLSLTLEEQELHINFCPAEMGKNCEVYTTIPHLMKHLEKMVNKYPNECKLVKEDPYSYTVSMPFKLVKPRSPRIISEEQKKASAERLAKARENKKGEV